MIEIRPVRSGEDDLVGDLTVAAYDAVGRVSEEYRAALRDVASRRDAESTVLVAVDDGQIVGSVTIVSSCSDHFEHGRHGDGGFRMLAVAPAAQGSGIGRDLLTAAIQRGRAHDWRRLTITTMEWMPAAQRMYERAGFTRRPDLDVRFSSGVGLCYELDLAEDAAAHFPPPGPVPTEPPVFVPSDERPPGC